MKKNATYALFGGSFDPPHKGHQEIVQELLKLNAIDSILIVPTYQNPFKNGSHAPAQKRLEWCKKLFQDGRLKILDFEIAQQRPVYTIETYRKLSKLYNIKAIVIGADNLKGITKWRDFETLNNTIQWIVATRPGEKLDTSMLQSSMLLPLHYDVSSSEIREGRKLQFLDKAIRKQVERVYNITKIEDNE